MRQTMDTEVTSIQQSDPKKDDPCDDVANNVDKWIRYGECDDAFSKTKKKVQWFRRVHKEVRKHS